jgi:hypothetical protein
MIFAFLGRRREEASMASGIDRRATTACNTVEWGGVYLRILITALILRVNFGRVWLFSRHGEGFAAVLDHLTHFADAFGALGRALMGREDVARTLAALLDGAGDVTLAKTIAVADVQGGRVRL